MWRNGGSRTTDLLFYKRLITRLVVHPSSNSNLRAYIAEKIKVSIKLNGIEIEILTDKDYLDRNKDIIEVSDLLIICPKSEEEELKSGTWATYRSAKKINKNIMIIYPSGRVEIWPNNNFIKKIKKNINKGKQNNGEGINPK